MKATVRVRIKSGQRDQTYSLRAGLGLQALNLESGTSLEFDCRKADCGICILRVLEGHEHLSEKTASEADFLQAMHADENERLGCQCRVFGDVVIEVDEF